jgi:hypothetical protein
VPLLKDEGVNKLQTNKELASPSTTLGIFPNSDTLYSTAIFDLSAEDLIVTVPKVDPGRYWSFSFFDACVQIRQRLTRAQLIVTGLALILQ